MKKFISILEYDNLKEEIKQNYKLIYLDFETNCIPWGYVLC